MKKKKKKKKVHLFCEEDNIIIDVKKTEQNNKHINIEKKIRRHSLRHNCR